MRLTKDDCEATPSARRGVEIELGAASDTHAVGKGENSALRTNTRRERKMGKGKHQGGGRARSAEEIEADEGAPAKDDRKFGGRGVGGQSATAGMMPPSSSEEESEEEEEETQQRGLGGQSATAGMLPPNSSDEEEEAAPAPKSKKGKEPAAPELTRKEREQLEAQKEAEAGPDPETMRKDMERLALIKKRREDQAAKRVETDGWDRMKPLSADNHPPGTTWPPPS